MDCLIALRIKTGCRQYVFDSVPDFSAWACRHPYKEEVGTVLRIVDDQVERTLQGPFTSLALVLEQMPFASNSDSNTRN